MTVNEIVANQIIERLKIAESTGQAFYWVKPFAMGAPDAAYSYAESRVYSGINRLLLDNDEYLTFNKVKEMNTNDSSKGYHIRKGANSRIVVFFKKVTISDGETGEPLLDKETGKTMLKGMLRFYRVFSRQDIIDHNGENLLSKFEFKKFSHDDITDYARLMLDNFNRLINAYCSQYSINVEVTKDGTGAYFNRNTNTVRIPAMDNYDSVYEYCSTVAHEIIHSTMLPLKRNLDKDGKDIIRTDGEYSKEELTAEIGSEMLLNQLNIFDDRKYKENSLGYIQGWTKHLEENARTNELISAATKAEKACDLVLDCCKARTMKRENERNDNDER